MDTDTLRKKKIDRAFVDNALKEVPMYDSIALDPEMDDYICEILSRDQTLAPPTRPSHNNLSDISILSIESLYMLPHSKHCSQPSSPVKFAGRNLKERISPELVSSRIEEKD